MSVAVTLLLVVVAVVAAAIYLNYAYSCRYYLVTNHGVVMVGSKRALTALFAGDETRMAESEEYDRVYRLDSTLTIDELEERGWRFVLGID